MIRHCSGNGFPHTLTPGRDAMHNRCKRIVALSFIYAALGGSLNAQVTSTEVKALLEQATQTDEAPTLSADTQWWDESATHAIGLRASSVQIDTTSLVELALLNSAQIKVHSEVPLIRQTARDEARSTFDWVHFGETMWNDSSDPVGNTLTVGGSASRYLNQHWTAGAGYRKRTVTGGSFDVRQDLGWQDTNSNYFLPANQGTARLSIGFSQPLMRGRGQTYNRSLIVLSEHDINSSQAEFQRQLQTHVMEVIRGYWALYLERAALTQKVALYQKTQTLYEQIHARSRIDVGQAQLASAAAALEERKSDLVRARAAVENAETRLRALVNAVEIEGDIELVPYELPTAVSLETDTITEVEVALVHRPEVVVTMNEIQAACVRLNMAKNEMLPMLNLVTRTYVAGLEGDSRVFEAWSDQFSTGRPSYSAGLQYEVPVGRRAARANLTRRQIEIRQLQEKYRGVLESIKAEVEIAVRELHTSHRELQARHRSMISLQQETQTLEARWLHGAEPEMGSLNLQALLRSQERLTETEFAFSKALLTYNLSLVNIQLVNGTMLQTGFLASSPITENQ